MGPGEGLKEVEKTKILVPFRGSNSVFNFLLGHLITTYTGCNKIQAETKIITVSMISKTATLSIVSAVDEMHNCVQAFVNILTCIDQCGIKYFEKPHWDVLAFPAVMAYLHYSILLM
jgi:hypothetical protein